MKKILLLFISLIMIFSSMSLAFANEYDMNYTNEQNTNMQTEKYWLAFEKEIYGFK